MMQESRAASEKPDLGMRRGVVLVGVLSLGLATQAPARASLDYTWALPEWASSWSAPRLADNRGFAVEATGDAVYVAGVTGSHGQGAGDAFLLRYDPDGRPVWARRWGGFELDQAQDIAIDGDAIWVVGSVTRDDGVVEAAVLKFSTAGEILQYTTWSLHGVIDVLQGVAVRDGVAFVAGLTQPSRTDRQWYVARLDAAGSPAWWHEDDLSADWDEAWDVAVHGSRVLVAGHAGPVGVLVAYGLDGAPLGSLPTRATELRAITVTEEGLFVTGGKTEGRSTDTYVARIAEGAVAWERTTGGQVVGGGGYGIAAGQRGIYVAAGTYDFPAGGDAAIMRFSYTGDLEWTQVSGLPGFWDWNFDVDVRDGRVYVAGVLWRPGAEWYTVRTVAYREDFPTASLTGVVGSGDTTALDSFSVGDFLRWAEGRSADDIGTRSWVEWEGASNSGRNYGHGGVDSGRDPVLQEENTAGSVLGLQDDLRTGNYAFVRDYSGVRGSIAGGLMRFRYYISHDRLIPQGGYLYVGEAGIPLPPPPV
jgi:hypothetical protein